MPNAIELSSLSLVLDQKQILEEICVDVPRGEFLSIVGPNGAGKTSLLKCVMRIHKRVSGRIKVHGTPVERYSTKSLAKRLSYVPQTNGHCPDFTVEEFVAMGRYPFLSAFSRLSADDHRVVAWALDLTELSSHTSAKMNQLSGGERQRVHIAAAVAQGADVLLLDEPTTYLDPFHQSNVYRLLERLNTAYGLTIVAVTHDINNAVLWSDRILALAKGRVAFCGAPAELMDNRVLASIYEKSFLFARHPQTGAQLVVPDGKAP